MMDQDLDLDTDMELASQAERNAFKAGYHQGHVDGVAKAEGSQHRGNLQMRILEWLQERQAFLRS